MTLNFRRPGFTMAVAMLVLGLANSWASAQNTNGGPGPFSDGRGRGRGGPGGPGGPLSLLAPFRLAASQLGLTDMQKNQIQAIAGSHAEEWRGLADRDRQARQALDTAVAAQQFDEVTIRQRSAELSAVEADIAVARGRAWAEALQILTADQQSTLKEMESQQRSRGRGRRG